MKTIDGGINWIEVENVGYSWLTVIDYAMDTLYVCGFDGVISRSNSLGIPVGIEKNTQLNAFTIYPTPAKQVFTIDLGRSYSNIYTQITDFTGAVISK